MAQPGYVHQEYPKWVEKDGRKFIVENEAEYLRHFPSEPSPPPGVVTVGAAPSLRQDGPTVEEYVAAGYKAAQYPPDGYASRSTPEQIQSAVEAQAAATPAPSEPPAADADTNPLTGDGQEPQDPSVPPAGSAADASDKARPAKPRRRRGR